MVNENFSSFQLVDTLNRLKAIESPVPESIRAYIAECSSRIYSPEFTASINKIKSLTASICDRYDFSSTSPDAEVDVSPEVYELADSVEAVADSVGAHDYSAKISNAVKHRPRRMSFEKLRDIVTLFLAVLGVVISVVHNAQLAEQNKADTLLHEREVLASEGIEDQMERHNDLIEKFFSSCGIIDPNSGQLSNASLQMPHTEEKAQQQNVATDDEQRQH